MRQAAIFALPAKYEPFGLSVLEAALCGCALVLGDIPSLRENWEGAALFVPPDDEAALRGAIDDLIGSPALRKRLASCAVDRAAQFTSARTTDAYLGTYHQLLGAAAARPARLAASA
jgi:glycosyltransferase involved in cell wall biosynthesis